MALYNEVRPQTLSELKGQEDVVKILRKSVAGGTLPNACIFIGTRGTGKTTVARIIAKMVNCENPRENGDPCCECASCRSIREGQSLDVTELDAASNNGVDDVRRIIEQVQYESISKMRVVILDEVHMFSTGAFNALLKVLEEPPKGVMFVLCTTEAHKVPATILSRCRRFTFKTLTIEEISSKLQGIAADRGKQVENGALALIAKAAKGSMRDAESIFESFLEMDEITVDGVRQVLGYSSEERIAKILTAVTERQPWIIRDELRDATERGENLWRFIEDSISALVSVASILLDGDISGINPDIASLSASYTPDQVFELIGALRKVYESKPDNPETSLLAAFVGQSCRSDRIDELKAELEELKKHGLSSSESPAASNNTEGMEDDPEWDHLAELAGQEEDQSEWQSIPEDQNPFEDKPLAQETVTETVKPSTSSAPVITQDTRASLARAGFVLEEEDEEELPGQVETPVAREEQPTKEQGKSATEGFSLFQQFEALFK